MLPDSLLFVNVKKKSNYKWLKKHKQKRECGYTRLSSCVADSLKKCWYL